MSLRPADARSDADDLIRQTHAKNGPPMKTRLFAVFSLLVTARLQPAP
jgi:hypothetical protein